MNEKTISVDAFMKLADRQVQRAMANSSSAANWCAKHAPTVDVSRAWAAYNDMRAKLAKALRAYERCYLLYNGFERLATGAWKEGDESYSAWVKKLSEQWNDPLHKADFLEAAKNFNPAELDDDDKDRFEEGFSELIMHAAKKHGLPNGILNENRAQRLIDAYPGTDDHFKQVVEQIVAEHQGHQGRAPVAVVAPAPVKVLEALPAPVVAPVVIHEPMIAPAPVVVVDGRPAADRFLDDVDDTPLPAEQVAQRPVREQHPEVPDAVASYLND